MSYTDTQAQSPLIINQMPTATYEGTTKSSSEVYVVTDPAGKNMNNLTDTGYSILNNSKALETGAVCSDEKIYNDVYKYAYSTFDLSKFTIVGTPTITADWIVSNTTTSNYLTIAPQSSAGNVITVRAKVNLNDVTTSSSFVYSTYLKCDFIYVSSSAKVFPRINVSDGTSDFFTRPSTYGMQADTDYIVEWSHDNAAMRSSIKLYNSEGVLLDSVTGAVNNIVVPYANLGTVQVCYNTKGLVDLKYFFMAVDGIPIFSGTKIGLDVIKSDNYTVVGTPTISADGNLIKELGSISDASNYIQFPFDITATNWKVEGTFTINRRSNSRILGDTSTSAFQVYEGVSGLNLNIGNVNVIAPIPFPAGGYAGTYNLYVKYSSGTYEMGWKRQGSSVWSTSSSHSEEVPTVPTLSVLQYVDANGNISFDLNSIKYYINDKLVYQPCLKIPYAESKTGSKVVDVAYRNRVVDMYEQFGAAPYYTIDAVNKNFTLPQGEVYGLIETTVERNQLVTQSLNVVQNSQNKGVNENIFNSLRNDFHSTFDKSKFSVVGSPTITDDGIVSNITNSNYVYKSNDFDFTKPFRIHFSFNVGSERKSSSQVILHLQDTLNSYQPVSIEINSSGRVYLKAGNYSGGAINRFINDKAIDGNTALSLNQVYYYDLVYNGVDTYSVYLDNKLVLTETTSEKLGTVDKICFYSTATGTYSAQYPQDLKNFKIYIDGYPVFSGNKTGIDTIKPDDYTVVGTPTISADGVASGFAINTYITPILEYSDNPGEYKEYITFTAASDVTTRQAVRYIAENTYKGIGVVIKDGGLSCRIGNGSNWIMTDFNNAIRANTKYTLELIINSTNTTWILSSSGSSQRATSSNTSLLYAPIELGNSANWNNNEYFKGSIDLNTHKIYINGDLVYQPCLKIPYINSKDGKKMVYSVYQPRVQDCYGQFGQANYTVIDEDNKEYFLPLGSASGFYGKRVLVDSYRNGINYWEIYSDGTVEQGGSCTSGTAVNLLKPFADTNYVVTVPYSAKTKTSFTPSQTGDWIAKGQGSL